jgi:hypothetical protein
VPVLGLALAPAAFDLLIVVQPTLGPALALPMLAVLGLAAVALLTAWARYPRAAWLLAAGFAALAALGLQWVGAEVAPVLTLLSVVAVGLGGGFAGSVDAIPLGV